MFRILERLYGWWRDRQRAIDLDILWPSCKQHAHSLTDARIAFLKHMSMDPAWSGMTEEELERFVEEKLV